MSKREQLEKDARELREKAEALEAEIKLLPESERWRPSLGAYYHYVRSTGRLEQARYGKDRNKDDGRYEARNMFQSKKEAELRSLRLESMAADRHSPDRGEVYHYWDAGDRTAELTRWDGEHFDLTNAMIGNIHATADEAAAWGAKYAHAWSSVL